MLRWQDIEYFPPCPADRSSWRVAVLREPDGRGGSAAVHDLLAEGDEIAASVPRNHFELDDAESYLFIAGGIGITPILPMLAGVSRRNRPWRLAYGGRGRGSMAFLDELAGWGDRVTVWPRDERGLLDLAALLGEGHLRQLRDRRARRRPRSPGRGSHPGRTRGGRHHDGLRLPVEDATAGAGSVAGASRSRREMPIAAARTAGPQEARPGSS
jgi:hypothetical protein